MKHAEWKEIYITLHFSYHFSAIRAICSQQLFPCRKCISVDGSMYMLLLRGSAIVSHATVEVHYWRFKSNYAKGFLWPVTLLFAPDYKGPGII